MDTFKNIDTSNINAKVELLLMAYTEDPQIHSMILRCIPGCKYIKELYKAIELVAKSDDGTYSKFTDFLYVVAKNLQEHVKVALANTCKNVRLK